MALLLGEQHRHLSEEIQGEGVMDVKASVMVDGDGYEGDLLIYNLVSLANN